MAAQSVTNEVDRAVAGVRRAIGRLVTLLDADDPATMQKAARELAGLGAAAAVGPLADALARARSPRHRGAIVGALLLFRTSARAAVTAAITKAVQREPDAQVRAWAQGMLAQLIAADLAASAPGDIEATSATRKLPR